MRVVLLSEVFSPNMGYLENMLPKYLARLGADVHLVTLGLPPYYNQTASDIYRGFADTDLPVGSVEYYDGVCVHVLPFRRVMGYLQAGGLLGKLRRIHPDVVQTTAAVGWLPLQAAFIKFLLGYQLFTGNHYHASVFPLSSRHPKWWDWELLQCRIKRSLPGWLTSQATNRCYAIAPDCAYIATRFFGVPQRKVQLCSLGVDTDLFRPVIGAEAESLRLHVRELLGFSNSEIVCVYSGRFTEDKNPLLLASAVAQLRQQQKPFRGLFIGNGPQSDAIKASPGCVVRPFVPVQELASLFRAADVGVWPTQESTSMLDAAACGLPIVANHTMSAPERLDGNGITYQLNDRNDLVRVLLELCDTEKRKRMGDLGADKMVREFSWAAIATRRIADYHQAVGVKAAYNQGYAVQPDADLNGDPAEELIQVDR